MEESRRRHSTLFLIEMILSIFFFSVLGAICVKLFSEAYTLSNHAGNLAKAVGLCSNYAEGFRGYDGTKKQWLTMFPEGSFDESEFLVYYDKEWNLTGKEAAVNVITVKITEPETQRLYQAVITAKEILQDSALYELTVLSVKEEVRE